MNKIPSVLIVDDHADHIFMVKAFLNMTDACEKVYEARNGQEALDLFDAHEKQHDNQDDSFPPNLIFLDINMPGMNGFEFMEKYEETYAKQPTYQDVIIVFYSSSLNQKDIDQAMSYPHTSKYISKPIDDDLIKDLWKEFFEK